MKTSPERAAVLKLGGSQATNVRGANTEYAAAFLKQLEADLVQFYSRVVVIIGGGVRVRELQKKVVEHGKTQADIDYEKDMVGVQATQEHAQQLATTFGSLGYSVTPQIARNPVDANSVLRDHSRFITVLGGLQRGQTTDAVALESARVLQQEGYSTQVAILSNIAHIFTEDPRLTQTAQGIRLASLATLVLERVLSNDPHRHVPGMNVPIDPVAVQTALKLDPRATKLYFGSGHPDNFHNVERFLRNESVNQGTELVIPPRKTVYR